MQCRAETKQGLRCRNPARTNSEFCHSHRSLENSRAKDAAGRPQAATTSNSSANGSQARVQAAVDKAERETTLDSPQDDDPFRAIAEAMAAAAADMDLEDPGHTPDSTGESYGVLGKTVYSTTYGMTYGLMFPAVWAAGWLSANNSAGKGLLDGAESAKEAVTRIWRKKNPRKS